ncbi:MAG: glycosyltransferase [Gemmatimonadaceae bacterium]|nr:glycosyltransferase [Gemmatimonadaceae bacterium]
MLYIGLPSHNEATTIGVLLWRLRTVLADVSREYEVIVYDDASTDGTADVLAPYARVLPLTLLRGEQRVGTGGALDAIVRHVVRTTRYPRRDALLCMQADFTDAPTLVPEFLRRFEGGADLIIGERRTAGDAPTSVRRLLTAARWVLRPFVGITDVRDLTTSFRLARVAVLRDLLKAVNDGPVCTGDGWAAQAELLLNAAPHARRIETIPVTPTFAVRTRETRRQAWPDTLALARWAWAHRGLRVDAKVIARDVDQGNETSEVAEAMEEDRLARAERGERTEARREPTAESRRRTRADRPEGRARSEEPTAVVRDETASREKAPDEGRGTRRERGPKRERPARERREPVAVDEAIEREPAAPAAGLSSAREIEEGIASESEDTRRRRRRRGRRSRGGALEHEAGADATLDETRADGPTREAERPEAHGDAADAGEERTDDGHGSDDGPRTRRKRRTRRGRRRGERGADAAGDSGDSDAGAGEPVSEAAGDAPHDGGSDAGSPNSSEGARRRRNRRGRRGGRRRQGADGEAPSASDDGPPPSDD